MGTLQCFLVAADPSFSLLPALGWKLVGCPGPRFALKGRGGDLGNHCLPLWK